MEAFLAAWFVIIALGLAALVGAIALAVVFIFLCRNPDELAALI